MLKVALMDTLWADIAACQSLIAFIVKNTQPVQTFSYISLVNLYAPTVARMLAARLASQPDRYGTVQLRM